jgi:dihydrodipicolinate synthase/N-acetylneuraminate lyase
VPIVIYNFPGVAAGLDVNSESLETLGHHPNIVGVKLTCGGIAKVARIRATFEPSEFSALAGQSDWLTPALSVGGTGVITGIANLFPKVGAADLNMIYTDSNFLQCCIEIFDLFVAGKTKEAEAAQLKLARMEWGFAKGGINGTKWIVAKLLNYPQESHHCRRPYPQYADPKQQEWMSATCGILVNDEKRLNSAST